MSETGDFPTHGHTHAMGAAEMAARRHGANPSSRGPGGERRAGTIAFWIALAAIVLGLVALVKAAEGRSSTIDDAPSPGPDATGELGVGAPRDGIDSIALPVTVEPATDLVDGQTVIVSGAGFPPGATVGIVQCSPHLLPLEGVERCMVSAFGTATTDDTGGFSTSFVVNRFIEVHGQEIDCAAPAPEGHPASCYLAAGALDNYDLSGTAPLHFDPSAPAAPRPEMLVDAADGLHDYDLVQITIRNPGAGAEWHLNQCVAYSNPPVCGGVALVDPVDPERPGVMVSHDGSDISAVFHVRRIIDGVDCGAAPESCSIVAQDGASGMLRSKRVSFDPAGGLAELSISLAPPPHPFGEVLLVDVRHRAPLASPTPPVQCITAEPGPDSCIPVGALDRLVPTGSTGWVVLVPSLVRPDGSSVDCASGPGVCEVRYVDADGTVATTPIEAASG
jgi:hypothetical protein